MNGTTTIIAAWVGAIGALVALAWDFYKWKFAGAKIQIHCAPGMQFPDANPLNRYGEMVIVTAVNVGDAPTTITHVLAKAYETRLKLWRGKAGGALVFLPIWLGETIPHVLKPGEQWSCAYPESSLVSELAGMNFVALGVQHAVRKRPCLSVLPVDRLQSSNKDFNSDAGKARAG